MVEIYVGEESLITWNSSGFVRLRKNLRITIYDPTVDLFSPGDLRHVVSLVDLL